MLVLSRKLGEKIVIGEGIELTVVEIKGNRIRLGIAAPDACRIMRSECQTRNVERAEALLAGCRQ